MQRDVMWGRRGCLVVCVLAALVLGGCRSQGQDADESSSAPPAETPREAGAAEMPAAPGFDADAEGAAIVDLFESFCQAVRAGDGQTAVGLVDPNTLKHYETLRALAVEATGGGAAAEAVAARSIGDRLLMYQVLSIFGADHLRAMDGAELLRYGIESGQLLQKTCGETSALGEVVVANPAIATAPMLDAEGEPTDGSLRFVARDGQWKIDLTAPMHHAAMLMERDAKAREMSDDDYLRALIGNMPAVQPHDPWRRVTSSEGGFSVELPGKPDEVVDARDAAGEVSFLIAKSVTGTTMFAGHSELAAEPVDDAQREAFLRAVAAGLANSAGARVAEARGMETTQGLQGVFVALELSDGRRGAAQLLVDERKLYQLIAIGPAQAPASVWTRFFGSFERAGRAKPPTATE